VFWLLIGVSRLSNNSSTSTNQFQTANVDWALLNFMQDWFPIESKEKLKSNEKEAAAEEMEELGLDPNQTCHLM